MGVQLWMQDGQETLMPWGARMGRFLPGEGETGPYFFFLKKKKSSSKDRFLLMLEREGEREALM